MIMVIQKDHVILARRPDWVIVNKKRKATEKRNFLLAHHRVKLKESKKWHKHLYLASEQKKKKKKKKKKNNGT